MLESIAWIARSHSFRGVERRALVRRGCDQADRARGDRERRPAPTLRSRAARDGTQPRAVQQAIDHARPRSPRLAARRGVRARRPRVGERWSRHAARVSRRAARDARRSVRRRARRLRTGAETTQRVVALRCARPVGGRDARRARRATRERGRRVGSGPARSSWTAGPGGERGVRGARRRRPAASTRPTKRSGRPNHSGSATPARSTSCCAPRSRRRRRAEIERGVTLVGPHRDDWKLTIEGLDARTQASQGEQRSLALALATGRPGSGARAHRHTAGAAPRRRVQRARRPPVERADSQSAGRARRCSRPRARSRPTSSPIRCCGSTPAGSSRAGR